MSRALLNRALCASTFVLIPFALTAEAFQGG